MAIHSKDYYKMTFGGTFGPVSDIVRLDPGWGETHIDFGFFEIVTKRNYYFGNLEEAYLIRKKPFPEEMLNYYQRGIFFSLL